MDKITDEKLEKYFSVSRRAFAMANDNVNPEMKEQAETVLDMVGRYISDAKHFLEKDDKVTAFAALNYAHGWLDSAAMLGILTVKDNTLFTVDGD